MVFKGLLFLFTLWGSADGFSVVSQSGQVLAFVKQHDNEINVASVPLIVCGGAKTCKYSVENGKCSKKRQYMTGVTAVEGKGIVASCCEPENPGVYYDDDDCREITAHSFTKVDSASTSSANTEYVKSIEKSSSGEYKMSVCKPRCEGKKQQQKQQQNTPQPSNSQAQAPKKHKCFSGDMTVQTPSGTKRMDQVRAGDQVLVKPSDSQPIFEPIEWLYHRDVNNQADFITVRTASKHILRLSANHLIPIIPCSTQLNSSDLTIVANTYSKFAQKLRRGHCVGVVENDQLRTDRVLTATNERRVGIFSPITSSGTIVVNGVFVSCYSSFENHEAQHVMHRALIKSHRLMVTIWNSVFGRVLMSSPEDPDIPMALQLLLKIAKLAVPSNVY